MNRDYPNILDNVPTSIDPGGLSNDPGSETIFNDIPDPDNAPEEDKDSDKDTVDVDKPDDEGQLCSAQSINVPLDLLGVSSINSDDSFASCPESVVTEVVNEEEKSICSAPISSVPKEVENAECSVSDKAPMPVFTGPEVSEVPNTVVTVLADKIVLNPTAPMKAPPGFKEGALNKAKDVKKRHVTFKDPPVSPPSRQGTVPGTGRPRGPSNPRAVAFVESQIQAKSRQ